MTYEYMTGMGKDELTAEEMQALSDKWNWNIQISTPVELPKNPLTAEEQKQVLEQLRSYTDGHIQTMINVWQRQAEKEAQWAKSDPTHPTSALYQASADKALYRLRLAQAELARRQREAQLQAIREQQAQQAQQQLLTVQPPPPSTGFVTPPPPEPPTSQPCTQVPVGLKTMVDMGLTTADTMRNRGCVATGVTRFAGHRGQAGYAEWCCPQRPVEQPLPTLMQRPGAPWYKQPLVLLGAGILGGLALMKLMEQRGGMTLNPGPADYKVGDLVVNQMMAIGRVLAVHDDYVNVRVKSGYMWTTSNWPYEILMEPAKAASYIAFKQQQGEELP